MISVEDWAEIRRLHRAEQMPIRAIARQLGISKNTVKRALATNRPPVYSRPAKGSAVDAVEPQIRELLKQTPTMPATVIAERIGWDRGMTVLKERVRELRPAYLPVDPVSRTTYQPGELAQCDLWFPPVDIPLGYGQSGRPPVLVMVSGYSRIIAARMLPTRTTGDLIDGHWKLLTGWNAAPRMLVWDNEAGIDRGKVTVDGLATHAESVCSLRHCDRRFRQASDDLVAFESPETADLTPCSVGEELDGQVLGVHGGRTGHSAPHERLQLTGAVRPVVVRHGPSGCGGERGGASPVATGEVAGEWQ